MALSLFLQFEVHDGDILLGGVCAVYFPLVKRNFVLLIIKHLNDLLIGWCSLNEYNIPIILDGQFQALQPFLVNLRILNPKHNLLLILITIQQNPKIFHLAAHQPTLVLDCLNSTDTGHCLGQLCFLILVVDGELIFEGV